MKVSVWSILFLPSLVLAKPLTSCSLQRDCISFSVEENTSRTCGSNSCLWKVCLQFDASLPGCRKDGSISHACDSGDDSTGCVRDWGDNGGWDSNEIDDFSDSASMCVYVPKGQDAKFLLKDGWGCGGYESFDIAQGSAVQCFPSTARTCTGNRPGKECWWTVSTPAGSCGAPVLSPTLRPTSPPTKFPTEMPTPFPTPAVVPTDAPVVAPTNAPVAAPTEAPVVAPTTAPVAAPTDAPTVEPTPGPTITPTPAPTIVPTGTPVARPIDPGPPTSTSTVVVVQDDSDEPLPPDTVEITSYLGTSVRFTITQKWKTDDSISWLAPAYDQAAGDLYCEENDKRVSVAPNEVNSYTALCDGNTATIDLFVHDGTISGSQTNIRSCNGWGNSNNIAYYTIILSCDGSGIAATTARATFDSGLEIPLDVVDGVPTISPGAFRGTSVAEEAKVDEEIKMRRIYLGAGAGLVVLILLGVVAFFYCRKPRSKSGG